MPSIGMRLTDLSHINSVTELLFTVGDADSAQRLFTRSMELATRQLGSNDVSIAYSLNGLARICQERGDSTNALAHFERALALLEATLGDSHSDVAGVLNNISELMVSTPPASGAGQ